MTTSTKPFEIMGKTIYTAIEPIKSGRDNYNELSIEVGYQKPDYNPFNGKYENGGVYVYFKPIVRENGSWRCMMVSGDTKTMGFKVMVKNLSRRSQKWLDIAHNAVEPIKERIAELYNKEKWDEIADLVKETVAKAA